MKQAIALSLEETAENASEKDAQEEGEEEEEELMLRKAIGLSLEGERKIMKTLTLIDSLTLFEGAEDKDYQKKLLKLCYTFR